MRKRSAGYFIAVMIVCGGYSFLPSFQTSSALAQGKNTLNFDNKSGQDVVVRVFQQKTDKRIAEVKVSDGQTRGTSIADGDYYIVSRYPSQTGKNGKASYTFSKGDPFTIRPPAGKRSQVTITLHGVIHGNYRAAPTDEKAFER